MVVSITNLRIKVKKTYIAQNGSQHNDTMTLRKTVKNTTLYITTIRIIVKLTTLHKMVVSMMTLRITVKNTTFSITTLSIMTLRIIVKLTTLHKMVVSMMPFSVTTISITIKKQH